MEVSFTDAVSFAALSPCGSWACGSEPPAVREGVALRHPDPEHHGCVRRARPLWLTRSPARRTRPEGESVQGRSAQVPEPLPRGFRGLLRPGRRPGLAEE